MSPCSSSRAVATVLLLLIAGSWYSYSFAQQAKIIVSPQPVNTSVNGVANFVCTAVANTFSWEANGVKLNNKAEIIAIKTVPVNAGQRRSTLNMLISSTDNASNITCIAISLYPTVTNVSSNPVLLRVQGQLEPVIDLNVTGVNSTTVLISWSPPFTLKGVPIKSYNVTIINTASGESEQFHTDDPTLLYQPALGTAYIIAVVPINQAGHGQLASFSEDFPFPSVTGSSTSSMARQISSTESPTVTAQQETSNTQIFSSSTPIHSNNPSDSTLVVEIVGGVLAILVSVLIVTIVIVTIVTKKYCSKKRRQGYRVQMAVLVETVGNGGEVAINGDLVTSVEVQPKPVSVPMPENPENRRSPSQLLSPSHTPVTTEGCRADTSSKRFDDMSDSKIRKRLNRKSCPDCLEDKIIHTESPPEDYKTQHKEATASTPESTTQFVATAGCVPINTPGRRHDRQAVLDINTEISFSAPAAFPDLVMPKPGEYGDAYLRVTQPASVVQVGWPQDLSSPD